MSTRLISVLLLAALGCLASCGDERGSGKSSATVRAARRAFDGAPPVIPHDNMNIECLQCHNDRGMAVEGVGFAPPTPHGDQVDGALRRCNQCHVFAQTDSTFGDNSFVGFAQDLRKGERLNDQAPPVIPHLVWMRENCAACHTGAAAREEIRCSHPERLRCTQCHVAHTVDTEFAR